MSTDLLTPSELAGRLGVSKRTLNRWHSLRKGPPRSRIGNSIFYRQDAIESWIRANEIHPVGMES